MTARIINHAIGLIQLGLPPIEAIEVACAVTPASPASRERARRTFLSLLARAERS